MLPRAGWSALGARGLCRRSSVRDVCLPASCRAQSVFPWQRAGVQHRLVNTSPADASNTTLASRVLKELKLSTYDERELRAVFERLDANKNGTLEREELRAMFAESGAGSQYCPEAEEHARTMASELWKHLDRDRDGNIDFAEFQAGILKLADERDPRMWPVAGSMLFLGIGVGVILPMMPMIVEQLSLTQGQYGYVVSAFALSKLLANIPAGVFVDAQGRKPSMIGGLAVSGAGVAALGAASSLEHLLLARFVSGFGATFMMAGATVAVTDMSTPLNRARMLTPVMSAFSAGTVFGPAVGGCLVPLIGLEPTLYCVGGSFLVNALFLRAVSSETLPFKSSGSVRDALRATTTQWAPLLRMPELRAVFIVNVSYWIALAGFNMTVLPLVLAGKLGLSPLEIGAVFASQSAISVLGAWPAAVLADRHGPARLLAPGLGCMALSALLFPLAPNIYWGAVPLAINAVGSALLGSQPTALTANLVGPASRAQAIALARTVGDVGWLLGGMSVGTLATLLGSDVAMQGTGAGLLAVTAWYALRKGHPQKTL